ncbi:MAG: gamma-glutamyltransferase, partial [Pseudomonadota bacterium]
MLGPGDRQPSGRTLGTRSAVVAPNAAAATAHPLATQVALDIMKDGGTAIDAAIAANAMLGLVEPTGNGIGGDLFAIVWDPKTEKLYGYNGSGRSPMGATLADMQAEADAHENGEKIPAYGVAPISVPGTVDGWFALHERFGRLSMRDNLKPTIEYARNGAPIPEVIAYYWDRSERNYARFVENGMIDEFDNARETFFSPTPREGSLFRNPDLANTLTTIAFNGRDAFYKGSLARTMDSYMERIGGFMTYEDLAAHEGEWIEPICVTYRDEVSLCELGPNTQGVAALQMLQMLERFDLREMGWGSADATMAQVEAKRLAFADRALGYADPEYTNIKPEDFANPVYNQARGARIDLNKAMPTEDTLSNLVVSDEGYEFLISNRDKLAATILSESDTLPDWFQQWEETGLFDGAMVAGGSEETETDRDIFILANPEKVQKIEECLSRENGDLSGGWVLYPPLGDLNCSDGQADWGRDFFGDQIDDLRKANAKLQDGDTTYLTVTHKDGMMVSLIQSNYRGMGSGLVPDGLGF